MEFKGTKGEWKVSNDGIGENKHGVKFLSIDYADSFDCVDIFADMRKEKYEEELYANAQLIATAPELLKSLQELYNAIDSSIDLTPELMQSTLKTINKALNYENN